MARRRRHGEPVHGWLAINKSLGVSSAQATSRARRLLNACKAGHGGALDPLATGVLPMAFGEATKTVPYVMDGAKTYRFTVTFGEERSTEDSEGEVTAVADALPTRPQIEAVLPRFRGDIWQTPPCYSAVKVNGRRAYALARAGEEVPLQARMVFVDSLSIDSVVDHARMTFRVTTGKGVYVRSLARDLARAAGTLGYVSALRRLSCGPFHESDAISLDKLEALSQGEARWGRLSPIEAPLVDVPALDLTEDEARRLANGAPLDVGPMAERLSGCDKGMACDTQVVRARARGDLAAVVRVCGGRVWPVRVLSF